MAYPPGKQFLKKLICNYHRNWQWYPWTFIPENWELLSHKILYMNVYRNSINNSLKLEATQVAFKRWVFKQAVIHPDCGILLSNKKEWTMDVPINWMNFQRILLSEKSQSPKVTYNDSIHRTFSKWWNYRKRGHSSDCQNFRRKWEGERSRCSYKRPKWGVFMVTQMFHVLIVINVDVLIEIFYY